MRFLLVVSLVAVFAWLVGGAIDHEQGRAGMLSARGVPSVGGMAPRAESIQPLYQGRTVRWWARRAVQARRDANKRGLTIRRLRGQLRRSSYAVTPTLAIRVVFGRHAHEALRVAWCESRWDPGAANGQYLGLFQMGSFARSRYGHSSDALTQAQAAYAYFVDSGRDWSPWSCKP